MKNLIRLTLVVLLFSFCFAVNAQQPKKFKLGHIDSNELLSIMPGRDTAQAKLQAYATTLGQQLKKMQNELETNEAEYRENEKSWPELIRASKYNALVDLAKRIEAFQSSAQEDLQQKEQEYLQPIIDVAKQAIDDVAKENGYTYILDSGYGMVLYSDESDNILPLVKKKLKLK